MDTVEKIGLHWAAIRTQRRPERTRWWESPRIMRHHNEQVCGLPLEGTNAGLIHLCKTWFGPRLPFRRGISVGGSNGWKERMLLTADIVKHITVTELSLPLIEEGKQLSRSEGLSDRIDFFYGDAFSTFKERDFDLVYWDAALHHMFDVNFALSWSKSVLRAGGVCVISDFVGPTRMQWTDEALEACSAVRRLLPSRLLVSPFTGMPVPTNVSRPDANAIAADDPSESADSGRIMQMVAKHFPDAIIRPAGGAIYHVALDDILCNFDHEDADDMALLDAILLTDRQLALRGFNNFAVALCVA